MKRCPECAFSFEDYQHVCDFDGAKLVDEPESLPFSPKVPVPAFVFPSIFLRVFKSPVFLAVSALTGIMSSAVLIGYFDSTSARNSIAANQNSGDSVVSSFPAAEVSAQIRTPPSSRGQFENGNPKARPAYSRMARRPAAASRLGAPVRSTPSAGNQQVRLSQQRRAVDEPRKVVEHPPQKEMKVTAMLKTTWRVLKKPFKF